VSRYAKAIGAALTLLIAFAMKGPGEISYDELELAITGITTAVVFALRNREPGAR
jgi:hypothetical protein